MGRADQRLQTDTDTVQYQCMYMSSLLAFMVISSENSITTETSSEIDKAMFIRS